LVESQRFLQQTAKKMKIRTKNDNSKAYPQETVAHSNNWRSWCE